MKLCECGCGLEVQPKSIPGGPEKRFYNRTHKARCYDRQKTLSEQRNKTAPSLAYADAHRACFIYDGSCYSLKDAPQDIFDKFLSSFLRDTVQVDLCDPGDLFARWYNVCEAARMFPCILEKIYMSRMEAEKAIKITL